MQSYESYRAHMIAQEVTPLNKAAWAKELRLNEPHETYFTVTEEMAKHGELEPGNYCNHFGYNHVLIRTTKIPRAQ